MTHRGLVVRYQETGIRNQVPGRYRPRKPARSALVASYALLARMREGYKVPELSPGMGQFPYKRHAGTAC
jgi:hypothetical protein